MCSVTVKNMVQQVNYVTKRLESVNVGRDIQEINVMNVRYETNLVFTGGPSLTNAF